MQIYHGMVKRQQSGRVQQWPANANDPHQTSLGLTIALSLFILGFLAFPALAQNGIPATDTTCPADRFGGSLNCTANSVDIAAIILLDDNDNPVPLDQTPSCVAGESVTLNLAIELQLNTQDVFDIGVFIGTNTIILTEPALGASCAVFAAPDSPPPLSDLDGDACGDFESISNQTVEQTTISLGQVTVDCTPDGAGVLLLPALVSWDNNAQGTCTGPDDFQLRPATGAQCNNQMSLQVPIEVLGQINVTKNAAPADGTDFSFQINGPDGFLQNFTLDDALPDDADSLSDSITIVTEPLGTTDSQFIITETSIPTGFTLTDIDCDVPVVTDLAAGTVSVILNTTSFVANCTFTNEAITLTLDKQIVSGSPYNNIGDTINYEFIVSNTSGTSIAGPVIINDDLTANETCPSLTTIGNADTNLDVGESITCTASINVTQADLDNNAITNTATASASGILSNQDSETALQAAVLTASKTVVDENGNNIAEPNELLTYTIQIINSGGSIAENVMVRDLVDDSNITADGTQVLIINNASNFIPTIPTIAALQAGFTLNIAPGTTATITYNVQVNNMIVFLR